MTALDLLSLSGSPHVEVLEDMLLVHGLELHFNERLVSGDIVAAIAAARRQLASTTGVPEKEITPRHLEVAAYHPEEQAIYVAIEFAMPAHGLGGVPHTATGEQIIRKGSASRQVEMNAISVGNSAKILEFMDAIDLKRVIWLPDSE